MTTATTPSKSRRKKKRLTSRDFWREYESRAVLRRLRMSPKKIKPLLDQIRWQRVDAALAYLDIVPKRAARPIAKLIRSCLANWQDLYGAEAPVDLQELYISEIYVTPGGMLKRWRPVSRGRAHPYRRRLAHIFVKIAPLRPEEPQTQQQQQQQQQEEKQELDQPTASPETKAQQQQPEDTTQDTRELPESEKTS